jgi:hypothetical protein
MLLDHEQDLVLAHYYIVRFFFSSKVLRAIKYTVKMSFSYGHFGLCVAVIGPCSDICVSAYHHTFLYDRI